MRIKAKPTKHCGVQFRSRTEAKYTALFNLFDEPWTYESKRFALPSGSYLPDFFLQRLDTWVEVKGKEPTDKEIRLCVELAHAVKKEVAIAYGWPLPTVPHQPGLWIYSPIDCTWGTGLWWALDPKLTFVSVRGPVEGWIELSGVGTITDDVIRSIDDKFKKRIRTPAPKKR